MIEEKNKVKELMQLIERMGCSEIAFHLSAITGKKISPQLVSNWRHRGVSYRYQNDFMDLYERKINTG